MKKIQEDDDLKLHLKEQVQFLISSTNAYDIGFEGEAKRMAATIRLLLHDTSRSNSLLSLLKKKGILFYDTTAYYDPRNLLTHTGLVAMHCNADEWKYAPLLDAARHSKISFDEWWNKIVIVDARKSEFTRKDLILAVANKDGGSHVDCALDEEYHALSRLDTGGWVVSKNNEEQPLENIHLVSIRQIAYEVLKSLMEGFPNLITESTK